MANTRKFEDVKLLGMSAMMIALAYSFLPADAKDKIFPGHLSQEINRDANRHCWAQFNR